MAKLRICGLITISDDAGFCVKDGETYTDYYITNGNYFILGNDEDEDLLKEMNDAGSDSGVEWSIANGRVYCTVPAGKDVYWLNGETEHYLLRDILGFTGTTVIVSYAATTMSPYYFESTIMAASDLEMPEALVARTMSDTAVYSVYYGSRDWREVTFYFSGNPRSTTASEQYEGLRKMWHAVFSQGVPFRYYPSTDEDEPLPINRWVHPYGYQEYTHYSPNTFSPKSMVNDWYEHWNWSARWHPLASPAYDTVGNGVYTGSVSSAAPSPIVVAVNELVTGIASSASCGSFKITSACTSVTFVGYVSEAGLTLTARLYNLTQTSWAGSGLAITDTDSEEKTEVISVDAGDICRVHITLTGGTGAADEIGFLGSAIVEA